MLSANTLSALLATVIVVLVAARVVGARRQLRAAISELLHESAPAAV